MQQQQQHYIIVADVCPFCCDGIGVTALLLSCFFVFRVIQKFMQVLRWHTFVMAPGLQSYKQAAVRGEAGFCSRELNLLLGTEAPI